LRGKKEGREEGRGEEGRGGEKGGEEKHQSILQLGEDDGRVSQSVVQPSEAVCPLWSTDLLEPKDRWQMLVVSLLFPLLLWAVFTQEIIQGKARSACHQRFPRLHHPVVAVRVIGRASQLRGPWDVFFPHVVVNNDSVLGQSASLSVWQNI
jgi:hypothetical protein